MEVVILQGLKLNYLTFIFKVYDYESYDIDSMRNSNINCLQNLEMSELIMS